MTPLTKRRIIIVLVIVSVTIFAAVMGVLAPTIVNLYLRYVKEPTAPQILINHPYLIPFLGISVLVVISLGFVVYASIRDIKKNKNSPSDLPSDLSKALGIADRLLAADENQSTKRDLAKSLNNLAEQIRLYRENQTPKGGAK